jgi:regulator of protease activity HflC (stomatin/prohibitin superfamily)
MRAYNRMHLLGATAIAASLAGCTTIPSGRTGVEWAPAKGTMTQTLDEGFHFVSPFSRVYEVDLREQQRDVDLEVLAANGLEIELKSSILYQPLGGEASALIKETGPEYYNTLIGPNVRSSARRVVGRYSPEEIYSTKREQIEREIREDVATKLAGHHLRVNSILIREVHLPPDVQGAIQAKLQEEQKALEMRYVLERSRQEAERKRIEAAGIADYQATISKGLTDKILAWQGIEATRKLAESANAKVVVIGTGKEGLPLIFNAAGTPTAAAIAKNNR